ncbi:MAG: SDR family oxidoreductase [Propionicimonas sp.]
MGPVVLITGCSSGIGRATAELLSRAGYEVVATARRPDDLAGLEVGLTLALDVIAQASIDAALAAVLDRYGRIDALINNAGYAALGTIEEVPDDAVRRLYDVNVFGVLAMIRGVAPLMRAQRSGRIVLLSSVAGKLPTPGNGIYASSKSAVEALGDALRLELGPHHVNVSIIEPGPVDTAFNTTASRLSDARISDPTSPYRALYRLVDQFSQTMRDRQATPDEVARAIQRALEDKRPNARYVVGFSLPGRVMLRTRDLLWGPVAARMFAHRP